MTSPPCRRKSPTVKERTTQREAARAQRRRSSQSQIQQLRAQVHSDDLMIAEKTKEQEQIRKQIKLYQERVQSSPAVEEQYKELTRGYQTALGFLQRVAEKTRRLGDGRRIWNASRKASNSAFWILPICRTSRPFRIARFLLLGGLGGGLGLGLGLAFLLEMQDTSFKTERDVEFALHLPVLAMVPAIEPASEKKRKEACESTGHGSRGEGLSNHVPEILWITGKPVQRQSGSALSVPDQADSGSAGRADVWHSEPKGLHSA